MTRTHRFAYKAILLAAVAAISLPASAGGRHEDDRHGKHGYMGVSLTEVHTTEGDGKNGVFVHSVQDDSGAARAGLKADDQFVNVEGVDISRHEDIKRALGGTQPGDRIEVTVLRDGEPMTFDLELGERPNTFHVDLKHFKKGNHWVHEVEGGERAFLGVHVDNLSPQLARYFDVDDGILITEVVEDGPASRSGMQAGDVIVGIEGKAVTGGGSLRQALGQYKPGDRVEVEVSRRGSLETFLVSLGKAKDHERFRIDIDLDTGDNPKIKIHERKRIREKSGDDD